MTNKDTELTPVEIEQTLRRLYNNLTSGQDMLKLAEEEYSEAKAHYTVQLAATRIQIKVNARAAGEKMTVQDLDDEALMLCADEYQRLIIAEGMVKAAKSNMTKLLTQADIVRSLGASVREAMRGPQ